MCVSVLCRFCKENSHGKAHGCYIASLDGFPFSHEKWAPYSSVDSSQPSAVWGFASSFRLWLLWSLHSRSRWPSPGMRPACMKLYFLGHLQSHNLWCCARWTPTAMFTCCLCIDCLLNTWNLVYQFIKLLSNDTWIFSFESCRNRIPDGGSPACCCSRTLNYLKASTNCLCISRIKPPSMRQIFEVLSIYVSFWRDYVIQIQRKVLSVFSVDGYSFLGYFQTQELQILFLMMQHFGVLDSVCLCVYGWTSLA
jgi:hypothetical protein